MDKIKNILINIYKYSIIKADKNYISFECEKNDIDKLKNKILSINEKTLNTIKLYFLGTSKNLYIYKLVVNLTNDFDEDKISELLSLEEIEKTIAG